MAFNFEGTSENMTGVFLLFYQDMVMDQILLILVQLKLRRGEIVSILGPNGAGKSTAMKAMLGLLNLKSGSIKIDGKDITKLSPQDRVKEGISFVPQTKKCICRYDSRRKFRNGSFLSIR